MICIYIYIHTFVEFAPVQNIIIYAWSFAGGHPGPERDGSGRGYNGSMNPWRAVGTPKQQVQLSQFAENLSNGDAALFQRCYSLLQNSISSGRQSRGVQKVRTPTTGDAAALSRLLV